MRHAGPYTLNGEKLMTDAAPLSPNRFRTGTIYGPWSPRLYETIPRGESCVRALWI